MTFNTDIDELESYFKNIKPTILIVDDENIFVEVLQELFVEKGAKVFTAFDGDEAIRVYEKHQSEIDLVLMDVAMPRLDGLKASKAIRKINKDAKIILITGFTKDSVEIKQSNDYSVFIQKPFETKKLMSTIRQLL